MLTRMVSFSWPRDPPVSASQSARITGMSHHTQPMYPWFLYRQSPPTRLWAPWGQTRCLGFCLLFTDGPVIPATQEAEAGESFEPGRWRLQWAEIVPLHSSLGDRVRLHLKKKKGNFVYLCPPMTTTQNKLPLPWYRHIVQNQLSNWFSFSSLFTSPFQMAMVYSPKVLRKTRTRTVYNSP